MKLIIAIVQDEDAPKVIKKLMSGKYRVTKLASTGGFLKSGNTTLLIGVEDGQIDDVVEIIEKLCMSRELKQGNGDICVARGNIFVVDIDQFVKM
jgi:uncharacterized protein YaaQ